MQQQLEGTDADCAALVVEGMKEEEDVEEAVLGVARGVHESDHEATTDDALAHVHVPGPEKVAAASDGESAEEGIKETQKWQLPPRRKKLF